MAATFAAIAFAQGNPTDNTIRFYQWKIARDPDDFFNYDKLGSAYLRKGRETGDLSYYELAEKALKKSLALESTHREAVLATAHLASVYFAEHRFQEALDCAQKALTFETGDLSPYATIGDALLEMGEYDKAAAAFSKLKEDEHSTAPHFGLRYLQYTRRSNLEFLRGNPQDSIADMRRAAGIAVATPMPAESIAWTQFMLGEEYFQAGDLDHAESAERDAVTTFPHYHHALAELGKIRAAQGRFQESVEFYKKALEVIPLPTYAAALGDVYTKLGNRTEAKKEYDLVEFIGHLSALNNTAYNRELATFYADHDLKIEKALQLAQKELEVRHDIYTWDCLAWALYKNGRAKDASAAISKASAIGTKDALLFFHAGMIEDALGNRATAREYLSRALAINAHFHVLYAEVAERKLQAINSN
jgi:tetratricopeptide (TPR) repeat protein